MKVVSIIISSFFFFFFFFFQWVRKGAYTDDIKARDLPQIGGDENLLEYLF